MDKERYTTLRAQLVSELWREIGMHHRFNARARIRRIADLDFQHLGVPKEETLRQFNYDDPIKKNL